MLGSCAVAEVKSGTFVTAVYSLNEPLTSTFLL
jgi:hypothetical protein